MVEFGYSFVYAQSVANIGSELRGYLQGQIKKRHRSGRATMQP
jgi:hypothetical protein